MLTVFVCVSGAQGEKLEGEIVCSESGAWFPALLWPQQGENADLQFRLYKYILI